MLQQHIANLDTAYLSATKHDFTQLLLQFDRLTQKRDKLTLRLSQTRLGNLEILPPMVIRDSN